MRANVPVRVGSRTEESPTRTSGGVLLPVHGAVALAVVGGRGHGGLGVEPAPLLFFGGGQVGQAGRGAGRGGAGSEEKVVGDAGRRRIGGLVSR